MPQNKRNKDLGVGIGNFPDSWTEEQMDAFLQRVHDEVGTFVGEYSEMAERLTGTPRPANPTLAQSYDQSLAATVVPGEEESKMTAEEKAMAERGYTQEDLDMIRGSVPRDRLATAWDETKEATRGLFSAAARGLAPATTAAVAGAPFGPVGSATGVLALGGADALVQLTNAAFGTNWTTPSEAVKDLLTRTGAVDVPESSVLQWFENAVQQAGQAGAFAGLMNILSGTPGAAKPGQATRIDPEGAPTGFGPDAGTTGPASVPVTGARGAAETLSFGPAGQMAGAAAGGTTEQGATQALIERGMNPEWAQLVGSAAGMPADMLVGGMADRMNLNQLARDTPITDPRLARQAQLAEEFGQPLRPDEALGNPINDPSVRELSKVAQRARTAQGTGDYLLERVQGARNAGRRIAEDYGVEYSGEMSNVVQDRTPEVMQIFNSARNEKLTDNYQFKRHIIESLDDPNTPVDVSRSVDVLDNAIDRFSRLGENMFGDVGRRLSGIRSDLSGPHSLDDIETIRKAVFSMKNDELVPKGARGEFNKVVDELYSTLREDMGQYIQDSYMEDMTNFGPLQVEGTEIRRMWKEADEELANLMSDFRHEDIDTMINEAATKPIEFQSVEAVQQLHRANRDPGDYRKLYSRLNDEGRRLSEAAIFSNIIEEAGGPLSASPTKMAAAMQEYMPMLRAIEAEGGPDDIVERTTHFVDYVANVVDWIEGFTGSGLKESRLSLTEHPTGGIALSQGSRRLGVAGALFIGDMLQFGVGKTARMMNKPENMRRIMNIRKMETGSPMWRQATNALLRDMYREELDAEEAAEEE